MPAMKGIDILILANTGTDAAPVWTVVGGQRNATLHEENETIDTTAKDSASGVQTFEYGLSTWTISCDGVYVPNDNAYTTLQNAMRNKTKLKVRTKEGDAYTAEGQVLVTSRDLEGPYDGEATYSMELQGTGPLTPNPA